MCARAPRSEPVNSHYHSCRPNSSQEEKCQKNDKGKRLSALGTECRPLTLLPGRAVATESSEFLSSHPATSEVDDAHELHPGRPVHSRRQFRPRDGRGM